MTKAKTKKSKPDQIQRFKDMAKELAIPKGATLNAAFSKVDPARMRKAPAKPK